MGNLQLSQPKIGGATFLSHGLVTRGLTGDTFYSIWIRPTVELRDRSSWRRGSTGIITIHFCIFLLWICTTSRIWSLFFVVLEQGIQIPTKAVSFKSPECGFTAKRMADSAEIWTGLRGNKCLTRLASMMNCSMSCMCHGFFLWEEPPVSWRIYLRASARRELSA